MLRYLQCARTAAGAYRKATGSAESALIGALAIPSIVVILYLLIRV